MEKSIHKVQNLWEGFLFPLVAKNVQKFCMQRIRRPTRNSQKSYNFERYIYVTESKTTVFFINSWKVQLTCKKN